MQLHSASEHVNWLSILCYFTDQFKSFTGNWIGETATLMNNNLITIIQFPINKLEPIFMSQKCICAFCRLSNELVVIKFIKFILNYALQTL